MPLLNRATGIHKTVIIRSSIGQATAFGGLWAGFESLGRPIFWVAWSTVFAWHCYHAARRWLAAHLGLGVVLAAGRFQRDFTVRKEGKGRRDFRTYILKKGFSEKNQFIFIGTPALYKYS